MNARFQALLDGFFYDPDEEVGTLLDLPSGGALPGEAPREERLDEYLAFWLNGECYGIPIHEVREIVRVPPLTEVPRAAPNLLGVMNLRGEVIPVYDLKVRLRLSDGYPHIAGPESEVLEAVVHGARILVLHSEEEGSAGVLVDAVAEVIRLTASSLEPPPPGVGERDCVVALGRRRDQLCILIDVQKAIGG